MPDVRFNHGNRGARRAILLTCYMTGATEGQNLGVAGYSYDFVAQLFVPLLSRFGEVIPVPQPATQLDQAAAEARHRGLQPVHISFLPIQDVHLAKSCPNVVVPAWEFPDVPNEPFSDNPQNDWPATANQCASVWVGGPFTEVALRKAGTRCPIHIVPVPTPDEYFALPPWDSNQRVTLRCRAFEFPRAPALNNVVPEPVPMPARRRPSRLKRLGKSIESRVRHTCKKVLGNVAYQLLSSPSHALRAIRGSVQEARLNLPPVKDVELSGIVYTSIFNPIDGRKNWMDLLTGFLLAIGDRPDVTLAIKLITGSPIEVQRVVTAYLRRAIPHQCKLIFIFDYLPPEQMLLLAKASTYYIQTTKAEGNCLPLMNYMAACRPAITPCHSAIQDYFDERLGFIVESNPEPAAWPHDRQLKIRTSWGRLVWPSLVAQTRASYRVISDDPATYQALARASRAKMRTWASVDAVGARISAALQAMEGGANAFSAPTDAVRRAA